MYALKKGRVKAQQESSSHLQAKQKGLKGNPTFRYLDLGLLAPGTVRKLISVVLATDYGILLWQPSRTMTAGRELDTFHVLRQIP